MRNVELAPSENIGIVEINDKGDAYRIVWGLDNGAKPTSEFPSHFMNHSVRVNATNGSDRVIYHCHATNIIALTFIHNRQHTDAGRTGQFRPSQVLLLLRTVMHGQSKASDVGFGFSKEAKRSQ